jgi:hypothetical protein
LWSGWWFGWWFGSSFGWIGLWFGSSFGLWSGLRFGFEPKSLRLLSVSEAIAGVTHVWDNDEMKHLSLISVMSDGVTRVQGSSWQDVVLESLSFKSMTGEFLKRRFIRMYKQWAKGGIVPLDDIACATMYLNHSEGK